MIDGNPVLDVEIRDSATGEVVHTMSGRKAEVGSTVNLPVNLVTVNTGYSREVIDFIRGQEVVITIAEGDQ